jgi:hypothetical protein
MRVITTCAAVVMAAALLLLSPSPALAQIQNVKVEPECQIYFSFTVATSSQQYDNRNNGCTYWVVTYSNTGFTGLSLLFRSASNAAGAPGAWGAFGGTLVTGVNPNVALTQAVTEVQGYYPWLSIYLTSTVGAGTISGTVYGFRSSPSVPIVLGAVTANQGTKNAGAAASWYVQGAVADGAAAAGNPVASAGVDGAGNTQTVAVDTTGRPTVVGPVAVGAASAGNPVMIGITDGGGASRYVLGDSTGNMHVAGAQAAGAGLGSNPVRVAGSDGTNIGEFIQCDKQAAITLAGAGATQIIAASGATRIYVCQLSISLDGASNVQIQEGTGANCGTGTANVSGNYRNVLSMVLGIPQNPFRGSASQALCLTLGSAVNGGGLVQYAQF